MVYVVARPDALVFTGPKGGALRRGHFNNLPRWVDTVRALGMPGRPTSARGSGASSRDLTACC
jgi:hypothetical protein